MPFPAASADDDRLIPVAELRAQVLRIFLAAGSDAREAGLIADHLVLANLLGHDSHGISLIPLYLRMVREKKVAPNTHPTIVQDAGALLTLDGGRGFGQAVAHEAMATAIARTAELGSVILSLRNSHHVGRIGHWAEQCAAAGLVSLHFVNVIGGEPVVAPYAGSDARLHTNPIAIGMPRSGQPPLVLDFATSRVAQGKMRVAMNRGIAVPDGYLIDAQGRPTTDPSVVYRPPMGALLPFGEYKGSGLALMCDLLAGALSGAGTSHPGTLEQDLYLNNMFSVLVDPARLGGAATWQQEIEAGLAFHRASPPRAGQGPVLLPGEPERATRRRREQEGIPVDRTTWSLIAEAARAFGIEIPL